uniref:Uncharacterized protein n=1 Tax=Acrobeloides nanus TaxID=290746 RepID=A0A914DHR8_9BILA
MMEICSSNDNQFYSNRLFEEIETSIHFILIETQKFEENVNACFDQIQQLGNDLMQSTHFDEYQYNQIFMQLESNKSGIIAISDELKNNVLLKWKIRQQELSVGCINENDQTLLQSLQSIDGSIVQVAAVLNRLVNSKAYFVANSLEGYKTHLSSIQNPVDNALNLHRMNILTNTQNVIIAYRKFLFELIGDLFNSSIIVYKQPPAIVTMFETRASTKKPNEANKNDGESKKSGRNSRFSFDTEICLLGEPFWYQYYGFTLAEVTCEVDLLTENNDGEQKFTIQPSSVEFCPPDPKDPKMIRSIHNIVKSTALFANMRIAQKNEDVQLRLFTDHDKKHLLHILEQKIPNHLAEKGIECKCYQCERRKNGHEIAHGKICISSIIDHIVCMKFATKNGKTCLQESTFNEWFYKVAEIAGVLKKHWNSREIFGFCDQAFAEVEVLLKPDRILIRFADTMQGQLRLSMADSKTPQKYTFQGEEKERPKVRHITIKYAEHQNSVNPDSFNDDQQFYNLIKTAAKLYNINHIYEDFKIDLESSFEEETNLPTTEYDKNTTSKIIQDLLQIVLQDFLPIIHQGLIPIILQDLLPIILQDFIPNSSRPYSNNSSGPSSN